jgi:1-deoxy-D-xylulose-5-phosphate reductoisomerase
LDFGPPDFQKFPLLRLAYQVLEAGGFAGCVLNAADEVAVEAFLDGRITFSSIPDIVEETLQRVAADGATSIPALLALDQQTRGWARELIKRSPLPVASRA